MLPEYSEFYLAKEQVDVERCDEEGLVLTHDEQSFQASFFNVHFVDETAHDKACELLMNAHRVEVEIDPQSSHDQPIDVYLFTDGYLFQKELIEKGLARISIRNPEYLYEAQMEGVEEIKPVMAETVVFVDHKEVDWFYLPCLLMVICLLRIGFKKI